MAKVLTEKVLREEELKLVGAYVDRAGKFWLKETYPYTAADKGMFYLATEKLKLVRLASEFAQKLIAEGRAILIGREDWAAFKKSVKISQR